MFELNPKGDIYIYKRPDPDTYYSLGADVAEGIVGCDHSCGCVIDTKMNQVAWYYGHMAPDLFGKELTKLGKYYNNATITIEINNHGITTVNKVRDLDYPNIYMRETQEEIADTFTKKLGWRTTANSKIEMLDKLYEVFMSGELRINDEQLIHEMAKLHTEPNGKTDTQGKDRFIAMALAIQGLVQVVGKKYRIYNPHYRPSTFNSIDEEVMYHERQDENESYFD